MKLNVRVLIGTILIVAGVLAVVMGGFSYTQEREAADIGPVEIQVEEQKRVNIPLWAGAAGIVAGAVVLAASRKR
jgi:uncharacterized membrane protein